MEFDTQCSRCKRPWDADGPVHIHRVEIEGPTVRTPFRGDLLPAAVPQSRHNGHAGSAPWPTPRDALHVAYGMIFLVVLRVVVVGTAAYVWNWHYATFVMSDR